MAFSTVAWKLFGKPAQGRILDFDRRACAGRASDQSIASVSYLALDKSDPQPPLLDPSLGDQSPTLDGPHVLNLQIHRRKVFTRIEHAPKRDPRGRIGQGRQDPTMDPAHGIVKPLIDVQMDHGPS